MISATRIGLAALIIGALMCLAAGALAGAAYAWQQSANRRAECSEIRAETWRAMLDAEHLARSCECAVTGRRCPK